MITHGDPPHMTTHTTWVPHIDNSQLQNVVRPILDTPLHHKTNTVHLQGVSLSFLTVCPLSKAAQSVVYTIVHLNPHSMHSVNLKGWRQCAFRGMNTQCTFGASVNFRGVDTQWKDSTPCPPAVPILSRSAILLRVYRNTTTAFPLYYNLWSLYVGDSSSCAVLLPVLFDVPAVSQSNCHTYWAHPTPPHSSHTKHPLHSHPPHITVYNKQPQAIHKCKKKTSNLNGNVGMA